MLCPSLSFLVRIYYFGSYFNQVLVSNVWPRLQLYWALHVLKVFRSAGLDSHAALAVMKYLNSLSHLGHTIVSTIHQPRQEIFKSFDKLLLMSEGYLMFLAPPSYVLPWFNEILGIPYNKAKHGTVADWLLGAVAVSFQTTAGEDDESK